MLSLEGFSDVDWANNLDDRKSVTGICVFLGNNLITWSSNKQIVVCHGLSLPAKLPCGT